MRLTIKIIAALLLCLSISCGNRNKEETSEPVAVVDEELVEARRKSDSLMQIHKQKEEERVQAIIKKKQGYDASDTIPFGNFKIIVHQAKKIKINSNNRMDYLMRNSSQSTVSMTVSITNTGNYEDELPFVEFANKKQDNPIRIISRFFFLEKTKKLITDLKIKSGKTIKGTYQISGYGNPSIVCFARKDRHETDVDERLTKMIKNKGGEYIVIITDEYNGPFAKVNLQSILEEAEE